jgi:F420-dependent oxidoreductase-like protein
MVETAIMIEGQHGLTWDRWKEVGRTVEEVGLDGLYRSDHFTNPDGPFQNALDLWPSLTWLADNSEDIQFGSLVTPVSFRHPVHTARMAKDVDNLSDGRLTLGIGAGWQEREHETFGFDLLEVPDRLDRFEEGLTVIRNLLTREEPVDFDGQYSQLDGAKLLPRPERGGGTHLLVGGNGWNRTIPLAAAYADEWNGIFLPPAEYADHVDRVTECLKAEERDPADMEYSLMTQVVFGRDEDEVDEQLDGRDRAELREHGVIVGTGAEIGEHLDQLEEAGADRVMLQWLDLDGIDRLAALGDAIR